MKESIELYRKNKKGKYVRVPIKSLVEIVAEYKRQRDQEMRKEQYGDILVDLPPSILGG